MDRKTKILIFSIIVGVVFAVILLNYISSEFYSLRNGNPIKRVYFKNGELIKAEVVSNVEKIELGLAGRKRLAEDRGMLFEMSENKNQRFWMKGMQISIDIIWIENDRIVGCERNILPTDDRIFASPGKANRVLEVQAGFCDQHNVEINDPVRL